MIATRKIDPHDAGLPEASVRKRRRSRRLAAVMLTIAVVTAAAGWPIFGNSLFSAIHIREQPESLVIIAYALLIVSSVTLVLGLWYLLLAQVERLARMVDAAEMGEPVAALTCGKCGRAVDAGDRFCRHCGERLGEAARQG